MNKSKRLYIILALLTIASSVAVGCSNAATTAPTGAASNATVQRGNLQINITGSGNLAYSQTADLAFEMAGYVNQVLVKAGDYVKQGQEVARVDATTWQDQITSLTRSLTATQRSLTAAEEKLAAAQRQVPIAQRNVTTAQQQVDAKNAAMVQAQISLKNAQIALDKAQNTYTGPDIEEAQANYNKAAAYLQYAIDQNATATASTKPTWDSVVRVAKASLNAAQTTLNNLISTIDTDQITLLKMQLQVSQSNVQQAQNAIDTANAAVADAQQAVEDARTSVVSAQASRDDAQLKVGDAQHALDESKSLSPIVKAPFDGFVTTVNSKGGDEVFKGTVAMSIADPNQFQSDVLVSEMDIYKVKMDGDATIQADALTGLTFPARVNFISPTATISSGVVNYKVTVNVTALQPISPGLQSGQSSRTQTGQSSGAQSARPSVTPKATGQPASPTPGATPPTGSSQPGQGRTAQGATTVQLKQGLTVTVNLLVDQKTNVLLVPTRAITRQGQNATVQVITPAGLTEIRTIKTGISDYQNTEVTDGLTEGEKVVIPQSTAPKATTQTGGGGIPGIRIPGR